MERRTCSLEPQGRTAERRDGDREGRPCPALPQLSAVRAGLYARNAGDRLRRRGAFAFFRGACARGICDNMKTAVETIFIDRHASACNARIAAAGTNISAACSWRSKPDPLGWTTALEQPTPSPRQSLISGEHVTEDATADDASCGCCALARPFAELVSGKAANARADEGAATAQQQPDNTHDR